MTSSSDTSSTNTKAIYEDSKQQLTVARFFSKLLNEVVDRHATQVVFKQDGDTLVGTLFSAAREIKSIKLNGAWLGPIRSFVLARPSLLGVVPEDIKIEAREFSTTSMVRIPGKVVEFKVSQEERLKDGLRIVMEEFHPHPARSILERFGFLHERAGEIEQFTEKGRGLCVFAVPLAASQRELRALLQGVLGGVCIEEHSLGNTEERFTNAGGEASKIAAEGLVFVLHSASDIEATRSRAFRANKALPNLAALGCGAVVARVCDRCARVMVPERRVVDQIPAVLQPLSFSRYRVGLGCDECDNTGHLGCIFIGAIVPIDSGDSRLLSATSALTFLRNHGGVSLLEDGIKKATSGLVTIETVLMLSPNIPDQHQAILKEPKAKREADLDIGEDFFVAEPTQAPVEPLRGRAALRGPTEDSGALFPEALSAGTRVSRTKPLLLIVEDDPDQRSILEMIFRSSDYEVALARDGQEALDFMAQEIPDLVISDLMMPRIEGGELVRRIKADKRFKRVPVLMLTVVSDVEKEYQLLDLGADDYCEKTIQRKILLKRVANLLKRSS